MRRDPAFLVSVPVHDHGDGDGADRAKPQGQRRLAVVRGDGTLTFVASAGAPVTQRSWFVNVLEQDPDGRWRTSAALS